MPAVVNHERSDLVLVGRRAALYQRVSGWGLGWLYRSVANRVVADLPRRGRLLDVGTGPGRLLVEVARRREDITVVGVDPSRDMIDDATRRLTTAALRNRADAVVAGAEALPFASGSFDAVVSTLSGHHWADPEAAVAEQARVLRAGGRLWVVDLRKRSAKTLPRLLADHFAPSAVSRPRFGRLGSVALVCYRAERSSLS